jgi:hypothetical protein
VKENKGDRKRENVSKILPIAPVCRSLQSQIDLIEIPIGNLPGNELAI